MCWERARACEGAIGKKDNRRTATIVPRGDCKCPATPKVLDLTEARDAQFVTAGLVWSGTIRGEPPFVPKNASIASELVGQVTGIGCPGSKSSSRRQRAARGLYDASADLTTRQGILKSCRDIVRRGKNDDRPSDCGSAYGACRRLRAARRE